MQSNENTNKINAILNNANGGVLQSDNTSVPQYTNRILSADQNSSNIMMLNNNAQSINICSSDKENNSVFSS